MKNIFENSREWFNTLEVFQNRHFPKHETTREHTQ